MLAAVHTYHQLGAINAPIIARKSLSSILIVYMKQIHAIRRLGTFAEDIPDPSSAKKP